MSRLFRSIWTALRRARAPILWIGFAYAIGAIAGGVMVHCGNGDALRSRAALIDFSGNLLRGAIPSTVMGLSLALPFPLAVYRGWVGGIVSVDGDHRSRLRTARGATYYLGVLLLQLIPYSLAGGTGVRLGLAFLLPRSRWGYAVTEKILSLPVEGLRDVARIYVVVLPLFLVASLVEFLAQ